MYGKKQHKIHEGLRRQIWEPDYNSSSPLTDYKTNFACFDLFLAQLIIPMLNGSQTLCLLQESMKSCSKQYHWEVPSWFHIKTVQKSRDDISTAFLDMDLMADLSQFLLHFILNVYWKVILSFLMLIIKHFCVQHVMRGTSLRNQKFKDLKLQAMTLGTV